MASILRLPPSSVEAEASVLGALLLDRDAIVAVAEFLEANHFYDSRHSEIYQSIIDLYQKRTPIDVLTVSEELKKRKSLKKIREGLYLIILGIMLSKKENCSTTYPSHPNKLPIFLANFVFR